MIVFSIISVFALSWLLYLFVRQNLSDLTSILGLLFKLVSGIALGLIYKIHYQGGDTFQYFSDAGIFTDFIFQHPAKILDALFNTLNSPELTLQLAYSDHPRALFFTKLILPLFILSGGNYWILSLMLGFINFLCIQFLVRELAKSFSWIRKESAIAFYFLPTFVFWTSGLLKESLAIAALAALTAICFQIIRRNDYFNLWHWIFIIFTAAILWNLKYFYAAVAFPVLASFMLFSFINVRWKISYYILLIFLIFSITGISIFHYNLSFAHISDVIFQNYLAGIQQSGGKAINYYFFHGDLLGYIINLPLALFSGLFRPLPFEIPGLFPSLVAVENLGILVLTIIAFWKSKLHFNIKDPVILLSLIYVLGLAVLLAFSTPNFGTLSRFKVGYWPIFGLLVLALNKKSQALKT